LLLVFLFGSAALFAHDISLAQLRSIPSNATLVFQRGYKSFRCTTYGVVTLDELLAKSSPKSQCAKAITAFYRQHKDFIYFASNHLYMRQMYHVEVKNRQCIVFIGGKKTYSEMVLQNGLGFLRNNFRDKEYRYSFQKAQKNAKLERKGAWEGSLFRNCIQEYYAK